MLATTFWLLRHLGLMHILYHLDLIKFFCGASQKTCCILQVIYQSHDQRSADVREEGNSVTAIFTLLEPVRWTGSKVCDVEEHVSYPGYTKSPEPEDFPMRRRSHSWSELLKTQETWERSVNEIIFQLEHQNLKLQHTITTLTRQQHYTCNLTDAEGVFNLR